MSYNIKKILSGLKDNIEGIEIDYINALLSRADDILTRSNEIKSAWNSINPNNLIP